ncbi:hypothetical protein ACXN1G_11710 [Rhodococcus ruber]
MLRKLLVVTAVTVAFGIGSAGTAAADGVLPPPDRAFMCKWDRFSPECIALWLAGVATGSVESGSARD